MEAKRIRHNFTWLSIAVITLLCAWAGRGELVRFNEKKAYDARRVVMLQALAGSQEAVVVVDDHDSILMASTGMEQLLGVRSQEMIGRQFANWIVNKKAYAQYVTERLRETGAGGRIYTRRLECLMSRGDGSDLVAIVQVSAAYNIAIMIVYNAAP